jgi:hypothetical protein
MIAGRKGNMTRFEKLKQMSIDEVAEILGDPKRFPHAPCYICEYDEGPACFSPVACTKEFKAKKYKEWLEREV